MVSEKIEKIINTLNQLSVKGRDDCLRIVLCIDNLSEILKELDKNEDNE